MNIQEFKKVEHEIMAFYANTHDDDVSLFSTKEDTYASLLNDRTGRPVELIEIEVHHQIDPSYQ